MKVLVTKVLSVEPHPDSDNLTIVTVKGPANWRGTNWLGEVLTRLRDFLASKEYPKELLPS